MVRLRLQIIAVVAVALSTGCTATSWFHRDSNQTYPTTTKPPVETRDAPMVMTKADKAAPAKEFALAWQNRLAQLPDPSKNGAQNPGIVGQVFLYTEKLHPAQVRGELTIIVSDGTDRAPGAPVHEPNVWHFTADTLKKLVVMDERFGKSFAVFLPWPESWRDVSRLNIQARYDQPDTMTLFAQASTVTLDFTSPGNGQAAVIPSTQMQLPAVPDPSVALKRAREGKPAGPSNGVQQVGYAPLQPILNLGPVVPK